MNQILKIIFFILFFSGVSCKAQTYIQGKYAVPFNSIGSTAVPGNSTLLSIEQAYNKIVPFFIPTGYDYYNDIANYRGEYFLKNDLVINIRAQIFPSGSSTRYKVLSTMKNSFDADFYLYKEKNMYFSEIKKIKNYYTLINYTTGNNFSKGACIVDDQGKYMVFIDVFSDGDTASIDQAITMLHSIVNDITFN